MTNELQIEFDKSMIVKEYKEKLKYLLKLCKEMIKAEGK